MKSFINFVKEGTLKPGEAAPGIKGKWPTKDNVGIAASKFDVKTTTTGTKYTRKSSTFENPTRYSKNIGEQTLHPHALHVSDVGGGKYKVHAVGHKLADGIKVGEHLNDTELDDASEMGAKIKHINPKK